MNHPEHIRKRKDATATVATVNPPKLKIVASVASVAVARPETATGTHRGIPAKDDYNPAERYPAEGAYWRDYEAVPMRQAVLLSLGIEPRDISDPDDKEDGLSYGQHGREYVRRRDVLRSAIAAKVLTRINSDAPEYSDHISFKGFVTWAAGKVWPMPEWMLGIIAPQAKPVTPSNQSGVRERKKAETEDRHRQWQTRAEQLRAEHPDWPQLRISKHIAPEFGVDFKTINNNIKLPPPKLARNKVVRSGKANR
jgi:hypothetical protein